MPFPTWLVPAREQLFPQLKGRPIALRSARVEELAPAIRLATDHGCRVSFALLEVETSLAELDLAALPRDLPLLLRVPSIGPWAAFSPRLAELRDRTLLVTMPASSPENLRAARLLSAVKVSVALDLRSGVCDWESLTDLASYALLERLPHGTIEPFSFLADPSHELGVERSWSHIFLADPRQYGHVDELGQIHVLDPRDVEGPAVTTLDAPDEGRWNEAVLRWCTTRRDVFLRNDRCARCPVFKFCGATFRETTEDPDGWHRRVPSPGLDPSPEEMARDRHGGNEGAHAIEAEPPCRSFFLDLQELIEELGKHGMGQPEGGRPWRP